MKIAQRKAGGWSVRMTDLPTDVAAKWQAYLDNYRAMPEAERPCNDEVAYRLTKTFRECGYSFAQINDYAKAAREPLVTATGIPAADGGTAGRCGYRSEDAEEPKRWGSG